MNAQKLIAAGIILMLSASVSLGAGGIVGSAHDFSDEDWADNEICKPCHTPHNAIHAEISSRLWNHELSDDGVVYTLHGARGPASTTGDSLTTDLTRQGGIADMDAASRLCLSCHDGTVALDSFGGKTGTVFASSKDADREAVGKRSADLGTDLSNDHPVGKAAIIDQQYVGTRYLMPTGLPLATVEGSKKAVTCMSCHNPHGTQDGQGNNIDYLLRRSNQKSDLCLSCHIK